MQDILLSYKQYMALVNRLDEITSDVTLIKLHAEKETAFIDNYTLLKILQVTNRTVQRWRKSGRLPYIRFGKKLYYRVDVILNSFKVRAGLLPENVISSHDDVDSVDDEFDTKCKRCPLYLILNA